MNGQENALSIGGHRLAGRALLAPMSGITDLPFRRLAARFGAGAVVSEMVASAGILTGSTEARLRSEGAGLPLHIVQLAGCDPLWMGQAACLAEASGADVIDINMGCPAKKVVNGYSGSALMRDLDQAIRLIDATLAATSRPVTLKMRLGWDEGSINAPELARRAEASGIALIAVHARTRSQFYKGSADWTQLRDVAAATTLPVVGNGDVERPADAVAKIAVGGVDGVMIGRGACGAPWVVGQTADLLSGRKPRAAPEGDDLWELIAEHYEAMLSHYGSELGLRTARKHLGWYLDRARPVDPQARHAILTCEDRRRTLSMMKAALANGRVCEAA